MEPEIILADEPTGNLDTETGKKVEDILINLNKTKNITLVAVTHNRLLADRMSRVTGLRDGKLAWWRLLDTREDAERVARLR